MLCIFGIKLIKYIFLISFEEVEEGKLGSQLKAFLNNWNKVDWKKGG